MFILVTQADGSARRLTWVTFAIAIGLVAVFMQQKGATSVASEGRREAVAYLNENPYLEVEEKYRGVIPLEYAQALNAEFLRERAEWGLAEMPVEILGRAQREFNEILDVALAKVETLPVWKFGVRDADLAKPNWWAHIAAHETQAALVLSLVLLLCLGIALEDGWGHMLYGGFVVVGVAATGIASTSVNYMDATGLPWFGASGLIAALMGAYFVRSFVQGASRAFGMIPLPAFVVLPIWLSVEYFVVRGVGSPAEFISAPAIVHGIGFGFGAMLSAVIVALRLETKMLDRAKVAKEVLSNPTLERAMIAKESGKADQAYDLLRAEFRRTPKNQEVAIALWDVAVQIRKADDAVEPMIVVIESDLKAGRASAAVANWFALNDEVESVSARPQMLIRMGEVLLDEGHPQATLAALMSAVDGRVKPATPLLLRAVRIARDLDPGLTLRAATMALQDKQLGVDDRNQLTKLRASIESGTDVSAQCPAVEAEQQGAATNPEPHAREEATTQVELDTDAGVAKPDIAALDPQALDLEGGESIQEASAAMDPDSLEAWNDPGRVDPLAFDAVDDLEQDLESDLETDLGSEFEGDGDDLEEFDESDLVEALMTHEENFGEEATTLSEAFGRVAPDGDTVTEVNMPAGVAPAAPATPSPSDSSTQEDVTETTVTEMVADNPADPPKAAPTTYRELRIREGVPASIESQAIVVEVAAGKKTRLPFGRIEAISAAVVSGLGAKPVVVIDLIVNWSAAFDPIKVIRLRSDRFDPAQLVPGQPSQLDALCKMLSDMLEMSNAAPLPNAGAATGAPFATFGDIESYNRTVLGGVEDSASI